MLNGKSLICFGGEDWWYHHPHSKNHLRRQVRMGVGAGGRRLIDSAKSRRARKAAWVDLALSREPDAAHEVCETRV